jgi:hypothetical protein
VDVIRVILAVPVVVHVVFMFGCYLCCGSFYNAASFWVGSVAVLSVCGDYNYEYYE